MLSRSVGVVANGKIFFFFVPCVYLPLPLYPVVLTGQGTLALFPGLSLVSSSCEERAGGLGGCRDLSKLVFSFPLGQYPAAELLDQQVVLSLSFRGSFVPFSQWLRQFTLPPTVHKVFFSLRLPSGYVLSFRQQPFWQVRVMSRCGLDRDFPDEESH